MSKANERLVADLNAVMVYTQHQFTNSDTLSPLLERAIKAIKSIDPKDAEIARLSAALGTDLVQLEAERARNAAAWQPIETSPKDGTEVLLYLKAPKGQPRQAVIAHHMAGGYCIEDHPAIDEGWYFSRGSFFDRVSDPIGWMPLPSSLAIIPGAKS